MPTSLTAYYSLSTSPPQGNKHAFRPPQAHAVTSPTRRQHRTESDANAAMLLLSCMRREDSLPALGAPVAV